MSESDWVGRWKQRQHQPRQQQQQQKKRMKRYICVSVCAYRDIYWNGVIGMSNSWFVAAAADAVVPRYIAYFVCLFVCLSLWLFICLFCGRWTRWFWPELFMSQFSKALRSTFSISVGTHNECSAKSKRNMFLCQRIRISICPIVFMICSFITIVQFACFVAPIFFCLLISLRAGVCAGVCACVCFLLYLCVCHRRRM